MTASNNRLTVQSDTESAALRQTDGAVKALLDRFANERRFVAWYPVPKGTKTDKVPYIPSTGHNSDAQDSSTWLTGSEAAHYAAHGVHIGIVIAEGSGLFCVDLDSALQPDGQWSPFAIAVLQRFPGACVEVSYSGKGLHIFGCCSVIPEHRTRRDGVPIEIYTRKRFIAFGSQMMGDIWLDHTAALQALIAEYLPEPVGARDAEWTAAPHADWHGPTEDAALIEIALRTRSAKAVFGDKASFRDLWTAEPEALFRAFPDATGKNAYNASAADQALANRLAFYTGCDCERMERLMRESALTRGKWERPDYLRRTILAAVASTRQFYNDGKGVKAGAVIPAANTNAAGIGLDDFYAFLPDHAYVFLPTRDLWPAAGVDASVMPWPHGMKPSAWLDKARPVHQMLWAPGHPTVVPDRVASDGGWIQREGVNTFNLYRLPVITPGEASAAQPWMDLIRYLYPDDADHIVKWFAHRRQRPGEKINHALVFGGSPGIGKDTIMEPLKRAVGPWNFKEVAPKDLLADFNPHVKSVVLRVSEARDSGDMNRYALYEHCKTLLASPPDVLRCNEKNLREHQVFNVLGAIFTTNHKDGLYLPADDRRHYVAWSDREQTNFPAGYWAQFYAWLEGGQGHAHVVAYLDTLDLATFDAKAPPPKTPAFWEMVDAGRAPEDGDMADALDKLGRPPAATVAMIQGASGPEFVAWLLNRQNRKQIGHRLRAQGYDPVRNTADKHDGQWRVQGKRQTIYARRDLAERDRLAAAAALCKA